MPDVITEAVVVPWLKLGHTDEPTLGLSGSVPVTIGASMRILTATAPGMLPDDTFLIEFDVNAPPQAVADVSVSDGKTQSVTTVNTSTSVTTSSTAWMRVGMSVAGTGIPGGATIASITSATVFVLSAAATASGTVTATFTHATLYAAAAYAEHDTGSANEYGNWYLFAAQCYDELGAPVAVEVDISVSDGTATPEHVAPRFFGCIMQPLNGEKIIGASGGANISLTARHTSGLARMEVRIVTALV